MPATWALILGIIQGLTEFLPVSSSGHLVIAQGLFGVKPPGIAVEVAAHAGTLGAILAVYGRDAVRIAAGFLEGITGGAARRGREFRLALLIVLASVPAAAAGLLWKDAFEGAFESTIVAGFGLVATGIILLLASGTRMVGLGNPHPGDMSAGRALFVGVAQAVAIVPGISRSGFTISAGVAAGLGREDAAMFSFLLAIPAVAGATLLGLRDIASGGLPAGVSAGSLVIVALSAMVSGIAALRFFIGTLKRGGLRPFAFYCFAAGAAALLTTLIGGR